MLDMWTQQDVMRALRSVSIAQAGVLAVCAPDSDLSEYARGCLDTMRAVREAFGITPAPVPELRQLCGMTTEQETT